ncbi:serine O-acetyltransferase [Chitinolyticbacter meiyuanensis]|uniref:serine O-acetyltransferase n=1 Tax=Chitinolyticbacter meiyuanensis TaxID=682798 RepID=UPI0011E5AE14|nr:DapH/DapD/GlmU-related protein [Chitinolyticbacter meiyuanensis]
MLLFYRFYRWLYLRRVPVVPTICKYVNRIVFSIVLPPSAQVGRNVRFGYGGLGIVVHANAVIGDNVVISPNVVIGGRSKLREVPVIEDDVQIGAGACILGPVRIGRGAKVGANAVVLEDIPPGSIAVGVPARVIRQG